MVGFGVMLQRVELMSGGGVWLGEDGLPTALGLVVSEHVDKIARLEPGVEVVEKELCSDRIRFVLRVKEGCVKPVDEIVRGYRIGCFRIAREYGLVSSDDPSPIFLVSSAAV